MEDQVNFMTDLLTKTYDALRKLSDLNMRLAQQMIEDALGMSRQMVSCSDPFQMASAAMSRIQPTAEHLRSYQQQLMGMLTSVQSELARSTEGQLALTSRGASAMADQMARGAGAATQAAEHAGAARNPT